MKFVFPLCVLFAFLLACTKDRDLNKLQYPAVIGPNIGTGPNGVSIAIGKVKINEYVIKGTTITNEYGVVSDWVELYNTSSDTIIFESGKWFMTDTLGEKTKWQMPPFTLYPHGFKVIWCDNQDNVNTQIHTSFSLSNNGEDLGLAYRATTSSNPVYIDSLSYPANTPPQGNSKGRLPDGANIWQIFATPSPGTPN